MKKLTDSYLLAVDFAWNEYQQKLTLEQWAACHGLDPEVTGRLRLYLQRLGVL